MREFKLAELAAAEAVKPQYGRWIVGDAVYVLETPDETLQEVLNASVPEPVEAG